MYGAGSEMGIMADTSRELAASAAKAAPSIAVTGSGLLGVPVSEWLLWCTLVYTILQTFILIRDKVLRIGPESSLYERIRRRIYKAPRQ